MYICINVCVHIYKCTLPRLHYRLLTLRARTHTHTGETLLHIAIAQRNHALVDYLLSYDVTIDNKARGIFFQPKHGDLRDVHVGTYYGSTPLCFAASIGDAELMDTLTVYCRKLVLQGLESGWRPPVAGCVCMYVCMYVCVCVCITYCAAAGGRLCIDVCLYGWIDGRILSMLISCDVCVCVCVFACVCVCMCVCVYVRMYVCMYV
jgi:hypothetical protein